MKFLKMKMIAQFWKQKRRQLQRLPQFNGFPSRDNVKKIIYKLFFYGFFSILIGILVGIATTIFGQGLLYLNALRDEHPFYFIPFLGVAGCAIMFVYIRYGGRAQKGMGLLFDVGYGKEKDVPLRMVPLTIFSTWTTHLFGGSAGREGVAVQIGATISMQFARFYATPESRNILLSCGMAAGFAGLFGTPIAATFFALEVLIVGTIYYDALLPTILTAYVSSFTARSLGLLPMHMPIGFVPEMTSRLMAITIGVGVLFGAIGWLFSWLLNHLRVYFALLIHHPMLRIFIIGSLLSILLIFGHAERYAGLSDHIFVAAFTGGDVYPWDWILKLLFTVVTLAAGFQGGELTPLFVIGAAVGSAVAIFLGLPVALFAAMGCVAVFGSATKTMFTPIFIGAEVFGAQGIPFFILVAIVAFIISGHYGIYTGQQFFTNRLRFREENNNQ